VPALGEQTFRDVRADEARAARDEGHAPARPSRRRSRRRCDLLDERHAAVGEGTREQLRTAAGVVETEVVMTRVDVEAVAGAPVRREILGGVPVDPLDRGLQHVDERARLPDLVVPPGREAGLGDPDRAVEPAPVEHGLDGRDLVGPAAPDARPAAGERVHADDVEEAEDLALGDEVEPVRVGRRHAPEHRPLAALAGPVGRVDHHLRELLPRRVEPPVPVVQVVRLVPELDRVEEVAVGGDERVEEVGVVARPPGRRLHGRHDPERGRRVVEARQ
jgi:hypothetical protein